jgi:hypothetical protein
MMITMAISIAMERYSRIFSSVANIARMKFNTARNTFNPLMGEDAVL